MRQHRSAAACGFNCACLVQNRLIRPEDISAADVRLLVICCPAGFGMLRVKAVLPPPSQHRLCCRRGEFVAIAQGTSNVALRGSGDADCVAWSRYIGGVVQGMSVQARDGATNEALLPTAKIVTQALLTLRPRTLASPPPFFQLAGDSEGYGVPNSPSQSGCSPVA
jgi:hypothetical protein